MRGMARVKRYEGLVPAHLLEERPQGFGTAAIAKPTERDVGQAATVVVKARKHLAQRGRACLGAPAQVGNQFLIGQRANLLVGDSGHHPQALARVEAEDPRAALRPHVEAAEPT